MDIAEVEFIVATKPVHENGGFVWNGWNQMSEEMLWRSLYSIAKYLQPEKFLNLHH